jgi:F0F1-type ATP synthase assembly protein I
MTNQREPRDDEEDVHAEIERIERELAEQFEQGQERVESGLNPLFTNPPHPGPIPEVLQKSPAGPQERPPTLMSGVASMGAAWGMAFDFVVTILAGLGLGWLFDRWQGSSPWGILAGLGVGFVAAFVRIIRNTQRIERQEAAAREAARRK